MLVDNPEFTIYGDVGGVSLGLDGVYTFDGAAGSSGLSLRFPESWKDFNRVTFRIGAKNLRPSDGAMALIINDGYKVWSPPVSRSPYPWIGEGETVLTYPLSVFTGGAVSFQLNETFGHSTNWEMCITGIELETVERNYILLENPDFLIYGDTSNKTRNADGSYTFAGDASALVCLAFPEGWRDFGNVSFFIDGVENHVDGATMSLIVKSRYRSWGDIDRAYDRYPNMEPGDNVLTYPTSLFHDGTSLQLNQYGHSLKWTMRPSKIVFHDDPLNTLF